MDSPLNLHESSFDELITALHPTNKYNIFADTADGKLDEIEAHFKTGGKLHLWVSLEIGTRRPDKLTTDATTTPPHWAYGLARHLGPEDLRVFHHLRIIRTLNHTHQGLNAVERHLDKLQMASPLRYVPVGIVHTEFASRVIELAWRLEKRDLLGIKDADWRWHKSQIAIIEYSAIDPRPTLYHAGECTDKGLINPTYRRLANRHPSPLPYCDYCGAEFTADSRINTTSPEKTTFAVRSYRTAIRERAEEIVR